MTTCSIATIELLHFAISTYVRLGMKEKLQNYQMGQVSAVVREADIAGRVTRAHVTLLRITGLALLDFSDLTRTSYHLINVFLNNIKLKHTVLTGPMGILSLT